MATASAAATTTLAIRTETAEAIAATMVPTTSPAKDRDADLISAKIKQI